MGVLWGWNGCWPKEGLGDFLLPEGAWGGPCRGGQGWPAGWLVLLLLVHPDMLLPVGSNLFELLGAGHFLPAGQARAAPEAGGAVPGSGGLKDRDEVERPELAMENGAPRMRASTVGSLKSPGSGQGSIRFDHRLLQGQGRPGVLLWFC